MNFLNKPIVLLLNKAWQAIAIKTPQESFSMMASDAATALDITLPDSLIPTSFRLWLTLPIRPGDRSIMTIRGPVRIPTAIISVNYAKVPKKRPKLNSKSIRERDGNRCQYTGRLLKPEEGSVDHVVPRSKGGKNDWNNVAWADKKINARKGNKSNSEAGLKLLKQPRKPLELPATALIENKFKIPDWDLFLKSSPK